MKNLSSAVLLFKYWLGCHGFLMGNAAAVKLLKRPHGTLGSVCGALCIPLSPTQKTGPLCSLFTTVTDTVRPLTPPVFGPRRATSLRGIINHPGATRLDWPPVPLWPYEISLNHMSVDHHPSQWPEEGLISQEQQHEPALLQSGDRLSCSVSHSGSSRP